MSYSLADLTQIVGAKRRTIQLWAEAKVIRADATTERAGTGYHRQFTQTEAIIACLVFPFAIRQISIGELLSISDAIRRYLKQRNGREIIHRVIKGSAIGYLTITTWSDFESFRHAEYEARLFEFPPSKDLPTWLEEVGQNAIRQLEYRGAMSMTIRLNTYLDRLRR